MTQIDSSSMIFILTIYRLYIMNRSDSLFIKKQHHVKES
jgi:hypothetical protein